MKKNLLLAVVAFSALMTGCCKDHSTSGAAAPAPVPEKKERPAKVETLAFSVGDEVKAKLRLKIEHSKGNAEFSQKLFDLISDDLLSEAQIGMFRNYDGVIRLSNDFEIKDKTGEYVRVICKGIRVEMFFSNQLQMARRITLRPLPRKLGYDNAVEQYLTPAAREVRKFLARKIAEVNREQLAVREITVKIAGSRKGKVENFSQEVVRVAQTVSSIKGVLSYQILNQDPVVGNCTFRIVYVKGQLPQGMRNILNNKLAELK